MNKENGKFTIEEMGERIDLSYPNWDYEIIDFNGCKSPMIIRCNECGAELHFKKAELIFGRVNFCKCKKTFKDFHDKIKYLGTVYNFTVIKEGKALEKQIIKCNNCGCEMARTHNAILKTPWHCDSCDSYAKGRIIYTKEDVQKKLDETFNGQYELLKFEGMTEKALLKHHNCGMIFTIREMGDLFDGHNRGCPKCYQFKSAGEQAIMNFLEENNIEYIPQKTFAPLNKSKYRFDFFIPSKNLAIEYQGEQHYRDNGFFRDNLDTVQHRDAIKKQYCKENGIELLEIKYTELKNIKQILTSKFNDQS